jgi:hypothetical protein
MYVHEERCLPLNPFRPFVGDALAVLLFLPSAFAEWVQLRKD